MTKKVWEENWGVKDDRLARPLEIETDYPEEDAVSEIFRPGWLHERQEARTKLAAQAPAMARMLLEMSEVVIQDGPCPICGWFEEPYHAPDCKLISLLKTAGVIDQ